jgi:hypothetical protein
MLGFMVPVLVVVFVCGFGRMGEVDARAGD